MPEDDKSAENPERANRILDAALKLISHYGYDKTTVGEIAAEAGVSKGAIYLHWSSKEELFEALVWRETWRYTDDFMARVEADPDGGTLFGMFKHSLAALPDHPFIQALVGKDRRILGDLIRRDHGRLLQNRCQMSKEFFRQMQDAGAIRADLDPAIVAYIGSVLRYGFISIDEVIPPDEAPPLEAVLDAVVDIFSRAWTPEGGGNSEAGKRIIAHMLAAYRQQRESDGS